MRDLVVGLFIACALAPGVAHAQLRAGDVVFQDSGSRQGRVIREVTRSRWSHVGIVLPHGDGLAVLEAVQPVRWTSIAAWRRRARGPVLVRRLPTAPDDEAIAALVREGERLLGRDYDLRFEWGDERVYCSELVQLVFERALGIELTPPQRWREIPLTPRARALARRRGGLPDPDGVVVTPAALAETSTLVTVR